jgi:hypothetical protein
VELTAFTFDDDLAEPFVGLGDTLYANDANWIPPACKHLAAQLSPDFPFYRSNGNQHRHFLAFDGANPVGRATATINACQRDEDGIPVGCIGLFESTHDWTVASHLLKAATTWLWGHGVQRVWGPMNFDIWHGYRFMTRGFGEKTFHPEPYNKPCYPEFFERFGFTVRRRWNSVELTPDVDVEQMISRGYQRYRLLSDRGYRFEYFDPKARGRQVHDLYQIIHSAYSGFLGFTSTTEAEFAQLFERLRPAILPSCLLLVYDESGQPAGFANAILDLADALRATRGRSGVISTMRFVYRRRHSSRLVFLHGGVTSEEAAKRSGLGRAGFYCVMRHAIDAGYTRILMALRAENSPSRGLLGRNAPPATREYALYELRR